MSDDDKKYRVAQKGFQSKNLLFLPEVLPPKVYIILSYRPVPLPLQFEPSYEKIVKINQEGFQRNDIIIIIGYGMMDFEEAKSFKPSLVFPNEETNLID